MVKLLGEVESVKFGVGGGSRSVKSWQCSSSCQSTADADGAAPVEAVLLAVSVKVLVAAAGSG